MPGAAPFRLGLAVVHALVGLAIVLCLFPFLELAARRRRIRWWSAAMLRRLGIEHRVEGRLEEGAKLIVANHVSWLDVLALHALCPEARFVSKADVQRWPLVGRLVSAAETLYIERERKRDAMRVVHQIAQALREGQTVAAFPEGTTGDGVALLPFHANLLQAAIVTGTPVQAVALRYADARHAVSPAALWLGETTLVGSLWKIARAERLVVRVRVLAAEASADAERRALAARLRERIGNAWQ
ncbi:MAG: 1-acyl-sn-glycerol-3-phosphate acyltransferase [Burkholderiales bacterium]|nr:1-acyl-sn-glycerol-3-phosphate acyltransferase [Burkholderiales bacterium]MDE2397160.1 1-acyl-sn-glycerol-3-phosphate acyltransferase [Burkholderiales bacterium]MDE2453356.1 1-acyl-sn-glycerol-3-phosphate acyltransferase [Burkholderiales bacterium]